MAEKERAKALVREQRERDRLEKEKERMARVEKLQRAHSLAQQQANSSGGGGGGGSRATAAAAASAAARNDSDADADSDIDPEEAAANKKEYQQRIVQLWKDKAKKPPKPGGSAAQGAAHWTQRASLCGRAEPAQRMRPFRSRCERRAHCACCTARHRPLTALLIQSDPLQNHPAQHDPGRVPRAHLEGERQRSRLGHLLGQQGVDP